MLPTPSETITGCASQSGSAMVPPSSCSHTGEAGSSWAQVCGGPDFQRMASSVCSRVRCHDAARSLLYTVSEESRLWDPTDPGLHVWSLFTSSRICCKTSEVSGTGFHIFAVT